MTSCTAELIGFFLLGFGVKVVLRGRAAMEMKTGSDMIFGLDAL